MMEEHNQKHLEEPKPRPREVHLVDSVNLDVSCLETEIGRLAYTVDFMEPKLEELRLHVFNLERAMLEILNRDCIEEIVSKVVGIVSLNTNKTYNLLSQTVVTTFVEEMDEDLFGEHGRSSQDPLKKLTKSPVLDDYANEGPHEELIHEEIFIPLHDNMEKHWFLLVMHLPEKNAEVLDSFLDARSRERGMDHARDVMAMLQKVFGTETTWLNSKFYHFPSFTLNLSNFNPTHEQKSENGVFVIRHMQYYRGMWSTTISTATSLTIFFYAIDRLNIYFLYFGVSFIRRTSVLDWHLKLFFIQGMNTVPSNIDWSSNKSFDDICEVHEWL